MLTREEESHQTQFERRLKTKGSHSGMQKQDRMDDFIKVRVKIKNSNINPRQAKEICMLKTRTNL